MQTTNNKTRDLVLLALFGAIIVVLWLTPFLGYIPLGFTKATTLHIPVIIASIILGPKKGAILGFVFGLTSFLNNSFISPTATSFVFTPLYTIDGAASGNFWSLVICFLPRILIGVVPYFVYHGISKLAKKKALKLEWLSLGVAGVAGSLTNTLLVMNFIYLFFGSSYAEASNKAVETLYSAITAIILVNGVPEAIVAAIIVVAVCKALLAYTRRRDKKATQVLPEQPDNLE